MMRSLAVQEGQKWQRRRPRWLAITRVGADLLQRVAQCVYRPWASVEKTSIDLADIPDAYKVIYCGMLLTLRLQSRYSVRVVCMQSEHMHAVLPVSFKSDHRCHMSTDGSWTQARQKSRLYYILVRATVYAVIPRCYRQVLRRAAYQAVGLYTQPDSSVSSACKESHTMNVASLLQAVYTELLRQCFNTYKAVRETAVSAVMSACKRFPCLAPLGLIIAIRAMAKLPQLTEKDMHAWLYSTGTPEGAFDKLLQDVFASRGLPSLPAPTTQSAAGVAFYGKRHYARTLG